MKPSLNLPAFPRMMPVRQNFPAPAAVDVRAVLRAELPVLAPRLKAGARIAVGVGSRGISNLQPIVATVVEFLKAAGAKPFVVPAMGSHGGATPQGQIELLAEYGISEAALGIPLEAAMEARVIVTTPDQAEVFFIEAARGAIVAAPDLERREAEVDREAQSLMPRLPFDDIDLLIVDQLG